MIPKRQKRSPSETKIFARERERNAYAFSACLICSFASSIFDIFLRMVPRFLLVRHNGDEIMRRDPEIWYVSSVTRNYSHSSVKALYVCSCIQTPKLIFTLLVHKDDVFEIAKRIINYTLVPNLT